MIHDKEADCFMKFLVDTHSHTIASGHAYSTITEMAEAAAAKGLKALALTEHAPEMPGTCGLFYFQNLDVVPRMQKGIRLLMGAEVNIMDPDGTIDLPENTCRDLDIVVASVHRAVLRAWTHGKGEYACLRGGNEKALYPYYRTPGRRKISAGL